MTAKPRSAGTRATNDADRPAKAAPAKAASTEATATTAGPAKAAPAKAVPAKAAKATAAESPQSETEGAEDQVPMNRAERRAKGRGKGIGQVPGGRGKVTSGHGPAHTQRNWANRRTG